MINKKIQTLCFIVLFCSSLLPLKGIIAQSNSVKCHFIIGLDVSQSINVNEALNALSSLEKLASENQPSHAFFFAKEVYPYPKKPCNWDSVQNFYSKLLQPDVNKNEESLLIVQNWLKSQDQSNFSALFRTIKNYCYRYPLEVSIGDNIIIVIISDLKHTSSQDDWLSFRSTLKSLRFIPESNVGELPAYLFLLEISSSSEHENSDEDSRLRARTIRESQRVFNKFLIHKRYRDETWITSLSKLRNPTFIGIDLQSYWYLKNNTDFIKFSARFNSPYIDTVRLEYRVGCGENFSSWKLKEILPGDHVYALDDLKFERAMIERDDNRNVLANLQILATKNRNHAFWFGGSDTTNLKNDYWSQQGVIGERIIKYILKRKSNEIYINPGKDTVKLIVEFENKTSQNVSIKISSDIISHDYFDKFSLNLIPENFDNLKISKSERHFKLSLIAKKTDWGVFFKSQKIPAKIFFPSASNKSGELFPVYANEDNKEKATIINIVIPSRFIWWCYSFLGLLKNIWRKPIYPFFIIVLFSFVLTFLRNRIVKRKKISSDPPWIDPRYSFGSIARTWRKFKSLLSKCSLKRLFFVVTPVFIGFCILSYLCYELIDRNIGSSSATIEKSILSAVVMYTSNMYIIFWKDKSSSEILGSLLISFVGVLLNIM